MPRNTTKLIGLVAGCFVIAIANFGTVIKYRLDQDEKASNMKWSTFEYNPQSSIKKFNALAKLQKSFEFQKKYAIISICGKEDFFQMNAAKALETLKRKGFSTIVFSQNGSKFLSSNLAGIESINNKYNLISAIESVKAKADEKDLFLFCHFGHGEKAGEYNISLNSTEKISLNEFSRETKTMKATQLFLFDSCFSGGFAEGLGKNGTAISTSGPDKMMHFMEEQAGFSKYFFEGMEKYNNVGLAFDFAVQNDSFSGNISLFQRFWGYKNTPELISDINPYEMQF